MSQGNAPEVIVGAGILGCALARELMRRGRRPGELLVIDPNPVASQATARAAALLSLARPWQKAHWIPLVRRTLTAIDVLRDEGFFVPLERCGAVHLAASDAARAILADQQATAVLSDVSCSVVAPTDFAREMPWLHCAADLSEGCADPDLVRRFDPGRFADFDPLSADWQDRCAAARAAKVSG